MVSKTHVEIRTMALHVRNILILFFVATSLAFAQRNKSNSQQSLDWATGVVIDGGLEDWGDTLLYFHADQSLQYQIKNDLENLYVAMRVLETDRQMQVFSQGLSFMFNADGKRREGPRIIFPIADRLAFRSIMSADNDNRPDDMRKGALAAIRAIYVLGFEDVLDGQISLENTYGFRAAAALDTTSALCVEIAIPLDRLGIAANKGGKVACNVKINGIIMPTSGGRGNTMRGGYPYGGYGYPYGYGQQMPAKPREEPGVWIVAPLAEE